MTALLNNQYSIRVISWLISIGFHLLLLVAMTSSSATVPNQQLVRQQPIAVMIYEPTPGFNDHTEAPVDVPIQSPISSNITVSSSNNQLAAIVTPVAPNYLDNPIPMYPLRARKKGHEGTVILDITVSPNGEPTQIKILKSSGYNSLDQSAKQSVMQWTFISAKKNNRPIEANVEVPITFELGHDNSSG